VSKQLRRRPENIFGPARPRPREQYKTLHMIKNYFKVALRYLLRYKGYTLINILGLSTGIACCILIMLFVRSEFSYDRFHTKSARITRLFVSAIEHSSVLKTAEAVAERVAGVRLEMLPVTADGVLDLEALRVALREGKGRALVAVMAANNETGVIQPVAEISRLCREAEALLLVDAVTAAGKIDLDAGLCDYLTLSAHKLGGPQGAGALVVGDAAPLAPQMIGGGQQKGLRAGTENLSGIAGFGAAVETVLADAGEQIRIASVRDHFERALKARLPDAVIFGESAQRLGNTANVALPGLASQNIVIALDLDGVMVSSGSSCSSGKIAPSHVLSAMGAADDLAGASIRVSFGWNSTDQDADAVVASLEKLAARVRARAAA